MMPVKRAVGRAAEFTGAALEVTRELTQGDFDKPRATGANVPALQRISHRHKTAARAIAAGIRPLDVANMVGYTPQRISDMINNDPAFQNLVAEYAARIESAAFDETVAFQAKLLVIANETADEIVERLEDDDKRTKIPMSELRNLMGDALSRTVAPPKQTQPATVAPTKIIFNVGDKILKPVIENNETQETRPMKEITDATDANATDDS